VAELLRLQPPWVVTDAKLDLKRQRVDVSLEWAGPGICPLCRQVAPKHGHRERVWRDLDLCGDQLFLHARVPRIDCPTHGIHSVLVPWATGRSEFTDRFECLTILSLKEMSLTAVSRRLQISWDSIDGIMQRAVQRGMERRGVVHFRLIGIDEKAFKKGHKYFTIVSNLEKGTVIWVGEDRTKATINRFWQSLTQEQIDGIEGVAMDMWQPYYDATIAHLPDAAKKIVFDRFHITSYLTKAVDQVRRNTVRELGQDAAALKGTKYDWLRDTSAMDPTEKRNFAELRQQYTVLGRAWAIKEQFVHFWEYKQETVARRFFDQWYYWATHSQISPIIAAAKTIKRHFANILTYLKLGITNAAAEGLNSKIQWMKYQARGFRSKDRFQRAIMFHFGGLELLPSNLNCREDAESIERQAGPQRTSLAGSTEIALAAPG
jgi:transposase